MPINCLFPCGAPVLPLGAVCTCQAPVGRWMTPPAWWGRWWSGRRHTVRPGRSCAGNHIYHISTCDQHGPNREEPIGSRQWGTENLNNNELKIPLIVIPIESFNMQPNLILGSNLILGPNLILKRNLIPGPIARSFEEIRMGVLFGPSHYHPIITRRYHPPRWMTPRA